MGCPFCCALCAVYCILEWAAVKEPATCPQCKREFSMLYCIRELDGTVTDAMHEESVCLLQRALWAQRRPLVGLQCLVDVLSDRAVE